MDKIEELRESLVLNDVDEEEIKDKFDKIAKNLFNNFR